MWLYLILYNFVTVVASSFATIAVVPDFVVVILYINIA